MTAASATQARAALVDKPQGWTSFDVVRRLRRAARGKVGHAGTLDPFATGLLIVLVGYATRISGLLMDLPKEYLVTARFGAQSTTQDPTGAITESGETTGRAAVVAALDALRGEIEQQVPYTSAVKVGGEPLYRRAHRGEPEPEDRPVRTVRVYDLTLIDFDEERQEGRLIARVGKGTYVRTLVHDLGRALGCGAYAAALRRTRIGPFGVEGASHPDDVVTRGLESPGGPVRALSEALAFLPVLEVTGRVVDRVRNGNELPEGRPGRFRVQGPEGLLAVYEGTPDGPARPMVVFPLPQE